MKRLSAETRERILAWLESLAEVPQPPAVRNLAGTQDGYRVPRDVPGTGLESGKGPCGVLTELTKAPLWITWPWSVTHNPGCCSRQNDKAKPWGSTTSSPSGDAWQFVPGRLV